MKRCFNKFIFVGATCGALGTSGLATASGSVLPSSASPFGTSLSAMAQASAVYNTGQFAGNPSTPLPPNLPIQILAAVEDGVGTDTLTSDSYSYVPIFFADNSAPVDPAFPADVTNQAVDAAYLDNLAGGFGVTSFIVQVDGNTITLDDSYIVGVNTDPLLDGTPPGDKYITIAAFLSPFSVGEHTVGVGGMIGGAPHIFASAEVNVVPEPSSIAVLAAGCLSVMCRRRRS